MMSAFRPLELGLSRFVGGPNPRILSVSPGLLGLPCLVPDAGDFAVQVPASTLHLERDAWVLLSVAEFGPPAELPGWQDLPHGMVWRIPGTMRIRADRVVARRCAAGTVVIPGNTSRSPRGFWSRPHLILLAEALPAPPAVGEDRAALLAEATRVESIELRSGSLRATVQTRPCLRLSAFSRDGHPSLIAPGDREPGGIRTWFMAPSQDRRSPLIGLLTASPISVATEACSLTTGIETETGLEVLWEVRLDGGRDRLLLRQGLRNHGPQTMRLAVWSILAGATPASTAALLLRGPGSTRPALRLHSADPETGAPFATTAGPWPETGIADDSAALNIAAAGLAPPGHIKVGLRSAEGLCALIDGDDAVLSQVAAEHQGPYPEGDLNLTSYRNRDAIEIEHVGPLIEIAQGETAWMDQELRTVRLPGLALDPPDVRATRLRNAWSAP